jgi:hypothetical protein
MAIPVDVFRLASPWPFVHVRNAMTRGPGAQDPEKIIRALSADAGLTAH